MAIVTVIDIGNSSNEMTYFYQAGSGGRFNDQTIPAKVGNPSLFTLTFGLSFFDSDPDGSQDLFLPMAISNPMSPWYQRNFRYSQRPRYSGIHGIASIVKSEEGRTKGYWNRTRGGLRRL